MSKNQDLIDEVQKYLSWKKSKSFVAEKVGITLEELEVLLKELRKVDKTEEFDKKEWNWKKSSKNVNNEKGTLESSIETTYEPKNDIELAKLHKIDLTKYKISSYWSKLKPNGKFTSSVFATLRKPADYTIEDFTKFLSTWNPIQLTKVEGKYKIEEDILYPFFKEIVDVELNIADFHLAKKTFEGDNLASKELDYFFTVNDLVNKIKQNYNINKLVFPISNDFFHTDSYQNTTTNGTPQDVTAWYDEEYEKGFDILANAINYLCTQAKEVEVILVQGNHDRTKGFFVAHALEVFFKEYKNVKFQREHSTTKHVVLGNTFIGYHHGNSVKLENLPLIFKTGKEAIAFGNAKYREIHTGDKHHYMAKEIQGVRIQQMPSLSKTDRWHRDNNFENKVHAALALVYHPIYGKVAEFEVRL
jgi:hypothetical protein